MLRNHCVQEPFTDFHKLLNIFAMVLLSILLEFLYPKIYSLIKICLELCMLLCLVHLERDRHKVLLQMLDVPI